MAEGERNIRVEDSKGNSLGNNALIKDHREQGALTFSNDGSICFVRGSAEEGDDGYEIYDNNGILLAGEDNPKGSVHHIFFSPDDQYIGFGLGEKLILLNRNGQKVFEYKLEALNKKLGPRIEQFGFSKDGKKIIILSRTNLIVLDTDGNVLSKASLPKPVFGDLHFLLLNNDQIVLSDITRIWVANFQGQLKLVKQSGGVTDFSHRSTGFSGFDIVDGNIVVSVWNKVGDGSIVLINQNGDILDTRQISSPGGITAKGNYLSIFGKDHLDIFKTE